MEYVVMGIKLPKPESKKPELGQTYYLFDVTDKLTDKEKIKNFIWDNTKWDNIWLENGLVHLNKKHVKIWMEWWEEVINMQK